MTNFIEDFKKLLPRDFIYCDVGARWGIDEPWKTFENMLELISFEPDKEEYELLKKNKSKKNTIYQYALYKESTNISLNLTKARGCSSVYKPNHDFLKHFPDSDRYKIEDTASVEATSLDYLQKNKILSDIDFIKIDVQGAELDILQGGINFLNENIIGLEVEVEFQSLYEDQPLFSDVDHFIRHSLGLQLQDLRKTYWKYTEGINIGANKGQLIFGDALYFKPPHDILSWCQQFEKNKARNKVLNACLMGVIYGYLDYSLCLLGQTAIHEFVDENTIRVWSSLITNYGKSLKYKKRGAIKLSKLLQFLYRICQPTDGGWSSIGDHLGTRKKYNVFY